MTKKTLLLGITLFSMFFGAGNLIFAPYLGAQSASDVWLALAGMLTTSVLMPVLAIVIIAPYQTANNMISRIWKPLGPIFMTLVYLLIGPCIAIPRTASTALEMWTWLVQGQWATILWIVLFFSVALIMAIRPGKLKDILGKVMGPILIVLILLVCIPLLFNEPQVVAAGGIYASNPFFTGKLKDILGKVMGPILIVLILLVCIPLLFNEPQVVAAGGIYASNPFFTGLNEGYQTMDILAAFCFGIIIVMNIKKLEIKKEKQTLALSAIIAGTTGLNEGYQTMDILAAFCFGIIIVMNIKKLEIKKEKQTLALSAIIAGTLLASLYILLAFTASQNSGIFQPLSNGAQILSLAEKQTLALSAIIAGTLLASLYILLAFTASQNSGIFQPLSNGAQILSLAASMTYGSFGQILCGLIFLIACLNVCSASQNSGIFQPLSNGAQILSLAASMTYGSFGQILCGLIFLIACLNVCSGLLACCSGYFHEHFPVLSYFQWLMLFTIAGAITACTGLDSILSWSGTLLSYICPLSLVLLVFGVFFSIKDRRFQTK